MKYIIRLHIDYMKRKKLGQINKAFTNVFVKHKFKLQLYGRYTRIKIRYRYEHICIIKYS